MQLSDKNIISDMRTAYGKTLVELGSKELSIEEDLHAIK